MEALESQHFDLDLNSFFFFLFSKNKTYTVTLVLRIESEFLETKVEDSAQLIIQMLDYTVITEEICHITWNDLVCLILIV